MKRFTGSKSHRNGFNNNFSYLSRTLIWTYIILARERERQAFKMGVWRLQPVLMWSSGKDSITSYPCLVVTIHWTRADWGQDPVQCHEYDFPVWRTGMNFYNYLGFLSDFELYWWFGLLYPEKQSIRITRVIHSQIVDFKIKAGGLTVYVTANLFARIIWFRYVRCQKTHAGGSFKTMLAASVYIQIIGLNLDF